MKTYKFQPKEQHEDERQTQQEQRQPQQQSLNIENFGPYTNQPLTPYPDPTPPPFTDQPPPPYPGEPPSLCQDQPPAAYSTLSLVRFQPQDGTSPPPYQSRPPSPREYPVKQEHALSLGTETILTHKHACQNFCAFFRKYPY